VLLTINTNITDLLGPSQSRFSPRLSWPRAAAQQLAKYTRHVQDSLARIDLNRHLLSCDSVNCQRDDHILLCNWYYDSIIDALLGAGARCIPKTRKKVNAGWSELVEPERQRSLL
jgi:hypothetical protein